MIESEKIQTIQLDRDGIVISSTGNLLGQVNLVGRSAVRQFPFIESIFETLWLLQESITFEGVAGSEPIPSGYYNYQFMKIKKSDTEVFLEWVIRDKTTEFSKLLEKQQRINDDRMNQ